MDEYIGRGGKRKGAGRPKGTTGPTKKETEKVKPHTVSLTDAQYQKFIEKGGSKWLRGLL